MSTVNRVSSKNTVNSSSSAANSSTDEYINSIYESGNNTKSAKKDLPEFYVVKKGDTLSKISSRTGIPIKNLKAWNGLENDLIKIDQKIRITPPEEKDPAKKTNGNSVFKKIGKTWKKFTAWLKKIFGSKKSNKAKPNETKLSPEEKFFNNFTNMKKVKKTTNRYEVKVWENFSATPYVCSSGKLTIGYGHVISTQEELDKYTGGGLNLSTAKKMSKATLAKKTKYEMTAKKANEIFDKDLEKARAGVKDIFGANYYKLNSNQQEVLIEIAFNSGTGMLSKKSSPNLHKHINEGKYDEAIKELNYVCGKDRTKAVPGLCKRRAFNMLKWTSYNPTPEQKIIIKEILKKGYDACETAKGREDYLSDLAFKTKALK